MLVLLLAMVFNQERFDYYIDNNQTVLVKREEVKELDNPIVRMLIRRYNVVVMKKEDSECLIGVYNKKATVFIYRGKRDVK